jgi:GMP synthase (glutamine-hydrolysing)
VNIIVLRTGDVAGPLAEKRGEFDRLIRETVGAAYAGDWETVDLRAAHRSRSARDLTPSSADAFVITGGSASITEREPWMVASEAFIRQLDAAKVPLLGICLGHQMIAQALGGEIVRNPLGREIGTVAIERLADDPLFDGLGPSFSVNATHVDTVGRMPPRGRVLARTALDATAAFAIDDHIRAVQFHPELDDDAMLVYVAARRERIESEGLDYESIRDRVNAGDGNGRVLRNWVTQFVLPRARNVRLASRSTVPTPLPRTQPGRQFVAVRSRS